MLLRSGASAPMRQGGDARSGQIERHETLTERAYRLLEERIVTLQLKPGDGSIRAIA